MANRRLTDLSYGHPGEAHYDVTRGNWIFSRIFGNILSLTPLTNFENPIAAQLSQEQPISRQKNHEVKKQVHSLVKENPELQPSSSLLSELVRVSSSITALTLKHDPCVSELLAFGKATDKHSSRKLVPIAAIVCGASGEDVHLIRHTESRRSWDSHKDVQLSLADVSSGDHAVFHGNRGPVQQVCFAEKEGDSIGILAIRYMLETVILRPQFRRIPPIGLSQQHRDRSSRLDPNPIFALPISSTGGNPHADISFNPWYPRQFAVVDQKGSWSVWDMGLRPDPRAPVNTKLQKRGQLFPESKQNHANNEQVQSHDDGWAKVIWVVDSSQLIVCKRRHLVVYSIDSEPEIISIPELGLTKSSSWILDVKRNPIEDSQLFVVTSEQVLLLQLARPGTSGAFESEAKTLLSWRHFRGSEDTSLRLTIVQIDANREALATCLYSRLNELINVFTWRFASETEFEPQSYGDPYALRLPEGFFSPGRGPFARSKDSSAMSISSLLFLPVFYIDNQRITSSGPGREYVDNDVRFFQLVVLANDLSVHQCLYTSGYPRDSGHSLWEAIKTPNEINRGVDRIVATATSACDAEEDDDLDNFIDYDENQSVGYFQSQIDLETSSVAVSEIEFGAPRKQIDKRETINSERIYEIAFGRRSADGQGNDILPRPLDDCIELLYKALEDKLRKGHRPIQTLQELLSCECIITDIDQASDAFRDLFDSVDKTKPDTSDEPVLNLRPITTPSMLGFPMITALDLSVIYDTLLKQFGNVHIPAETPATARAARERIIRSVSLSIYLSCIGAQLVDLPPIPPPPPLDPSVASTLPELKLPVRPHDTDPDVLSTIFVSSSQPLPSRIYSASSPGPELDIQSSQPPSILPTPDPTTPTTFSPSASPAPSSSAFSLSSTSTTHPNSHVERLRAYTSFGLGATIPLSTVAARILSHWEPGSDPIAYDWAEADARARQHEEDEEAQREAAAAARSNRGTSRSHSSRSSSKASGKKRMRTTAPDGQHPSSRKGGWGGSSQVYFQAPDAISSQIPSSNHSRSLSLSQSQDFNMNANPYNHGGASSQVASSRTMITGEGEPGSSQTTTMAADDGFGIASQVERGAFGGRPEMRQAAVAARANLRKKRKGVAGFR